VLAELLAQRIRGYRKELALLLVAEVVLLGAILIVAPWRVVQADTRVIPDDDSTRIAAHDLLDQYQSYRRMIRQFEDAEATQGIKVVPDDQVQARLTSVSVDLGRLNYPKAHKDLQMLKAGYSDWNNKLQDQVAARAAAAKADARSERSAPAAPARPVVANYLQVPILLYHYTPGDFEGQLLALRSKGYTTITMDTLAAAMNRQVSLPAKAVVITFDDGFANQMQAYALLAKYGMRATFYIIDGGPGSNWCIGAGRQYGLPSQPPGGCGDQYLTWDQIRQLDGSGLIEIGSHTIDHPNLPSLSADAEWYEINDGKAQLENQLGHAVHTFAYPYGGYNSTTVQDVIRAGFSSAVTTVPGIDQTYGSQYTLHRVRSAYTLP
jgi:peptidoglycan/xylan/chitin deacetylase (PgdA/CDA1 family)